MDIAQHLICQLCPDMDHTKILIAVSPVHAQFRNRWGGKEKQMESHLDHRVYEVDHLKGLLK